MADLLVDPVDNPVAAAGLALFLRVALAAPFWLSGRTKIAEGTLATVSDTTWLLFETEYAGVPLPPAIAAVMATIAEHVLPALLVAGFATRAAAAGLLVMTMVIQLFVYPAAWWGTHMGWAALALAVLVLGPGAWSVDRLVADRAGRASGR